ncbi:MAG: TRAP transporter large permease subunit, partial [Anaerolineae bacterium]|nr:TRAP transporter large permease subunit [Anaerolineae bacterium]
LTIGMISGSPVADAAAVGALTIPTMKKKGFTSVFSASLAAVAANGGAFMPPVMGAAAFIMVEFTSMTYWEICKAALIPAVLFYFSIYMATDFEAGRRGIPRIPKEERPNAWGVLKRSAIILIPFAVLLYTMAIMHVTPQRSAALAFFSLIAVYVAQQGLARKMTPFAFVQYLIRVSSSGAKG